MCNQIKILAICAISSIILSGYGQHSNAAEKFVVEIDVPRVSFFTIDHYFAPIKKGINILGRISFKNNTQDGFQLTIKSTHGGQLVSEETKDGEYSIPYEVSLKPINQVLDSNIVEVLEPELYQEMKIPFLYLNGTASSMSYADYEIAVYIEDVHNALEMAGTYEDRLMIEYSDL